MRPSLTPPHSNALSAVQRLCNAADPYPDDLEDTLFLEAMNQAVAWHYERNNFFRVFLNSKELAPGRLKDMHELEEFPLIHANFFKTHETLSVPREEIALTLTSSGTTGQKSRMLFDRWSIEAGRRMVDDVHDRLGLTDTEQEANYLVLNYEPVPGMSRGTANTSKYLTRYAPAREIFYALRFVGQGRHEFDAFGCVEALKRFASQDIPVRIIGFPAFLFFILERMQARGLGPLQFSPRSLLFTAGGWKGYASREIPREELIRLTEEMLGIPGERIRDSFGSVDHSVPYIECPNHHKHVPVWSRAVIRDVRTLRAVPYGTPGFLGFFAPHMTSVPAVGVLMGDLASMYPGEACGCGISSPYFNILGRAGTSEHKSCAVSATELLKRAK
jgi:phenylacetate-coenzyme A ligase PaaK-like adenylate-forming protein